jgi:hypothetical protein
VLGGVGRVRERLDGAREDDSQNDAVDGCEKLVKYRDRRSEGIAERVILKKRKEKRQTDGLAEDDGHEVLSLDARGIHAAAENRRAREQNTPDTVVVYTVVRTPQMQEEERPSFASPPLANKPGGANDGERNAQSNAHTSPHVRRHAGHEPVFVCAFKQTNNRNGSHG